jgi:hypothetical protein
MKTAMQLMVWYLENEGLEESGAYYKAKMLLEKEKEQIMNAFSRGLGTELGLDWEDSEQYYNRIYQK